MGQKVTITLTVEAAYLYKRKNSLSVADIDNSSSLTDFNRGISVDGSNENFISQVYIDSEVKWVGVTHDPGYSIAIHSIEYIPANTGKGPSENFFNTDKLLGTAGKAGFVEATVKNDGNLENKLYCYSINFKIYPPGGCLAFLLSGKPTNPLKIDPKLNANA